MGDNRTYQMFDVVYENVRTYHKKEYEIKALDPDDALCRAGQRLLESHYKVDDYRVTYCRPRGLTT